MATVKGRTTETIPFRRLVHPGGAAALGATDAGICGIVLVGGAAGLLRKLERRRPVRLRECRSPHPHLDPAHAWLEELLVRGTLHRSDFALDLAPSTEFQREVWRALGGIPPGETRSYGALARALGRPGAARAVGAAAAANPVPPAIPCHRLRGADGGLRGYSEGLEMKKRLLQCERTGAKGRKRRAG